MKPNILVHVHCSNCDWDGMGDPNDDCYGCKSDSLYEVDQQDERCFQCGQRENQCECDDL